MCDTFTKRFNPNHSIFAKNSDRDPGEEQYTYLSKNPVAELDDNSFPEKKKEYFLGPYKRLLELIPRFKNPYSSILSRPSWIWGAEMGVNEKGVAIGNEAVFSRKKQSPDGLLGMDILRIALHNAGTAEEALRIITSITENPGQGGNGSYKGSLKYHNSYLICDPRESYVLETSSKSWIYKKIENHASISNTYTIQDENATASKDHSGKDFKKKNEDRLILFFAKGEQRQRHTNACLASSSINGLTGMISLLRSHMNENEGIRSGMGSICIHPGFLIKSQTTSSLVVEYRDGGFVVWHSSSLYPCLSTFTPVFWKNSWIVPNGFDDIEQAIHTYRKNTKFALTLEKKEKIFFSKGKKVRDEQEDRWRIESEKLFQTAAKTALSEFSEKCLRENITLQETLKGVCELA